MGSDAESGQQKVREISIEDLKKKMQEGAVVVIDVREPEEVRQTGALEHGKVKAATIPLGSVMEGAFGLPPEDFKESYGFDKPSQDADIVFSCRSGRRSLLASVVAVEENGYSNVHNYKGSAIEWFSALDSDASPVSDQ